jgi:aryl-phospho-beta-D-glucosidase BglC (GH1 family)
MNRRTFIKNTALATSVLAATGNAMLGSVSHPNANRLPRWKGFNLLDFFSPTPGNRENASCTTEDDFRWMADWGFDFVRIPIAYPRYLSFDRSKPITPGDILNYDPAVLEEIEKLVYTAHRYGLHVSLNLHRAPGYCINAGFVEPFNLWKDGEAQEAFAGHWGMWAERFRNVSSEKISFDLLNEPAYIEDMNDQFSAKNALPGDLYRKVAMKAAAAIRKANPGHLIIADGNEVGNRPTPELVDLDMGQSCRGYFPHYISHYQAPWVWKDPAQAPDPVWPGTIDGRDFSRATLEEYYRPWIGLVESGTGVHCGECGCWRKTPHTLFLAWFGDVIDILSNAGIGYALWNFRGDFGILDSGRKDVAYADWYGHKLDTKLLDLLKNY